MNVTNKERATLCPVCHTVSTQPYYSGNQVVVEDFVHRHGEYFYCQHCQILFQDPPFIVSELSPELIQAEVINQNPLGTGTLIGHIYSLYYRFTRRAIVHLRRLTPLRLLDVGCGTGQFCKTVSAYYEAWGVDSSPQACEVARSYGLKNIVCDTFRRELFDLKFNVITFWQTIEHLESSPLEALQTAFDLLEPGGILYIGEVPNINGMEFRVFGARCFYLASPVHNYIFSEYFFTTSLSQIGFKEIKIRHDWKNYTLLSGSFMIKLQDWLGIKLSATTRLLMALVTYPGWALLNVIVAWQKKSATFSIMALKPGQKL
ncbi:class I SAM-dependent methyltransferase [candidate division CSSED10-310 bacterium]|uniref:Class I SAM-dependent methyltransferase n=1 Tax=candidate division CSSED10-310 bacterium TaxID=2855610 RepID=A0ABV6Z5G1_UNCC1